jgi:dihydrofolate reductase
VCAFAENRRQDEAADALLVGRRTFTDFRGYWRDLDQDATGVSDYLNRVAKYVVSTTLEDPDWPGTTVIDTDPVAAITDLKAGAGGDIVVTGSITLTHLLLAAGLVDELRLFVYPAVQGAGRRLFPDGAAPYVRLERTGSFRCGIVLLCYRLV